MTTRSQTTPFEIESVTVTSRDFPRWHETYLACGYAEWGEYAEMHSVDRLHEMAQDPAMDLNLFQVVLRGRVAGLAILERLIDLDGGVPIPAMGQVLVPQPVRGHGIGRALMYKLEAVAAAKGDTQLSGISLAPSSRNDRTTRVLMKAGYTEGSLELRQEMDRRLAYGLAAQHPLPSSYRTEIVSAVPDDALLIELNQAIAAGMKQTYTDELLPAPDEFTTENIRHSLEVAESLGQRPFLGLLRTQEDKVLVGFTSISLSAHGDVHDDVSWVHPDHRAPEVINALRAAVLEAAAHACPNTPNLPSPRVITPIDTGSWLISANKLLGYRETMYLRWWHKALSP